MKKTDERILKYLSGMMTVEENKIFEKEIEQNITLYRELINTKRKLNEIPLPKEIWLDESYFNNLLPRIKEKLNYKKKVTLQRRISYAIPVIVLIITVIFFLPSRKDDYSTEGYKLLTEEVANNIDNEDIAGKYLDYSFVQNLSYAGINGEIDVSIPSNFEMPNEYINTNNYEYYNEYSSLENYSDDQLEKAYKYLSKLTL